MSWQTRFRSVLGHLDVPQDGLEHPPAGDRRLGACRLRERVAQILRDVLERPDVEVGGSVLDDLLEVGGNRHQPLALSAAAFPARRPKTQHSSRLLPIIRLRPCVPPAISPQAKRPSMVVSPRSSIVSPPFW